MTNTLTRRDLMAGTAAGAIISSVPLGLAATSSMAAARTGDAHQLCLSGHDWLGKRLHDVMKNPDIDEAHKNYALKSNTCPHCSVHIHPAETGLIAA